MNLGWNKGSDFNSLCVPSFLEAKVARDTYVPSHCGCVTDQVITLGLYYFFPHRIQSSIIHQPTPPPIFMIHLKIEKTKAATDKRLNPFLKPQIKGIETWGESFQPLAGKR